MTSSFPMKKNTATKIVFPILDADGDPVTGAAGLDSEYSLDGGAFADCASEATEISGGIYYLNVASGETNGDVVCIQVKTSTSGAKTTVLVFYTAAQTLDETDVIADAIKAKTDLIGASVALESAGNLAAVKAKTDLIGASVALESGGNIATILADTNEIQGKLPTNKIMGSSVVTDKDDEIDAIKAKTDLIGASVALETGGNLVAVKTKTDGLNFTGNYVQSQVKGLDDIDLSATMKTSVNTEIDNALDTAIPALPTANSINERVKTIDDKLPTNYIMGSSVATDKDDEIDAIKAKTDNLPSDPADESLLEAAITAAHATTNAKIDAVDDYVDTEIAAIKAITDTLTLANIADAVLDEIVDANNPANANSLREVVNVISATLAGKSSGGGTNTIKFRDLGDTKDRINATVTAVGDRTAVTQDGT